MSVRFGTKALQVSSLPGLFRQGIRAHASRSGFCGNTPRPPHRGVPYLTPRLASTPGAAVIPCIRRCEYSASPPCDTNVSVCIRARASEVRLAAIFVIWTRPFPLASWHRNASHGLVHGSSSSRGLPNAAQMSNACTARQRLLVTSP